MKYYKLEGHGFRNGLRRNKPKIRNLSRRGCWHKSWWYSKRAMMNACSKTRMCIVREEELVDKNANRSCRKNQWSHNLYMICDMCCTWEKRRRTKTSEFKNARRYSITLTIRLWSEETSRLSGTFISTSQFSRSHPLT